MSNDESNRLSPTVEKVLDEYEEALRSDESLDDAEVSRLGELLRQDKTPKFEEIDQALNDNRSVKIE